MQRVLKPLSLVFTLVAVLSLGKQAAQADPIVTFTGGVTVSIGGTPGVSFATPAGPAHTNITFNFFSNVPATTPTAGGTLFILTQAYTGTPAALNGATAGFLAQSQSISAGQYVFDASLTLLPNTTYFFYANTPFTFSELFFANPPGIIGYIAPGGGSFVSTRGTPNFLLSGAAVSAVPEPATMLLLASGLTGIVIKVRKRCKTV